MRNGKLTTSSGCYDILYYTYMTGGRTTELNKFNIETQH